MDGKFLITTIVTILIAVTGLVAKYVNDLSIANRKDKLERINRQLKEFYGPILSLSSSSNATFIKFASTWKNKKYYFDNDNTASEKELAIWRNWMKSVFIPINEKIYEIIINNGDLIIENQFPDCLKDFCAHVQTYRPIVSKWEINEFTEHTSLLNYPTELGKYIEQGYKYLKMQQAKLIK